MLKSLGEYPIAVAIKYLTYHTVVDGTVALHLQKHTYHQYSVIVSVITNKSIYRVHGIHDAWLSVSKQPESGIWQSGGPVSPPAQGCYYEQFDIDKQTLAPVYTFDPPLTAETAVKAQKVCNWVLGRFGGRFQNPTTDVHMDLLLHRIVPGKYVNGSHWERVGGLFGIYYNEALNEWREDPPPLEKSFKTPMIIEPSDPRHPSPLAEPRRVAPSGATQPLSRMSLAQRLLAPSAELDGIPPQRDAAYVNTNKIDHAPFDSLMDELCAPAAEQRITLVKRLTPTSTPNHVHQLRALPRNLQDTRVATQRHVVIVFWHTPHRCGSWQYATRINALTTCARLTRHGLLMRRLFRNV
jgi:hypothetical protein